jgi:hypothetical protein
MITRGSIRAASYIALVLAASAFFAAGAYFHARCLPPFCRGLRQQWTTLTAPKEAVIDSHNYAISTNAIQLPFNVAYGAIAVAGPRLLVASGAGQLYLANHATGRVDKLSFSVPFSSVEFRRHVSLTEMPDWFAVKDIAVMPVSGGWRILASHHFWNEKQACYTIHVSEALATESLQRLTRGWVTLFESKPCLKLRGTSVPFPGNQAGGRLQPISPTEVLLTVGDHERDGVHGPSYPQDSNSSNSYGKTILFDVVRRSSRIFTLGHRNPQGLALDSAGHLWLTDHGPRGGDVLELLRDGANYGWPLATYGTDYGSRKWPLGDSIDPYRRFTPPVFAWNPGIGISQLVEMRRPLFSRWAGDLLVSSLRAESLFRIRLKDEHVVFVESIPVGVRVRDIVEAEDGAIILFTTGRLLVLRPLPDNRPEGGEPTTTR